MGDAWSRKQTRELRELQGLAWERELEAALRTLRKDFDTWEQHEITPFELADRVHKFHNGRSRELFVAYSGSLNVDWILRAIAVDVIDETELSEDLHKVLEDDIASFRTRWSAAKPNRGA